MKKGAVLSLDFVLEIVVLLVAFVFLFAVLKGGAETSHTILSAKKKINFAGDPRGMTVIICTETPLRIMLKKVGFDYKEKATLYALFFYQGYVSISDKPLEFPYKEPVPDITSGYFQNLFGARSTERVTLAFMTENAKCIDIAKRNPKAEQFLRECGGFIVDSLPSLGAKEGSCAVDSCLSVAGVAECVPSDDCELGGANPNYACTSGQVCCSKGNIETRGEILFKADVFPHPTTNEKYCLVKPIYKNIGASDWDVTKKIKARIVCDAVDYAGSIQPSQTIISPTLTEYVVLRKGETSEGQAFHLGCAAGKQYIIELLANCEYQVTGGVFPDNCQNQQGNPAKLLDTETVDCK